MSGKGGILVFGRTGQVATELGRQSPAVCLDRSIADLADPTSCARTIHAYRPAVVINAATYTAVDRAENEEALATTINGESPGAMAQACAELGVPFVHVSTDYVFDGSGQRPWQPGDPVAPLGAYGRSKLAGEAAISASGARAVILRTSWVFSGTGSNFVKTMLRLGRDRDVVSVVSDQVGGPTPAADIARALLEIARQLQAGNDARGIFHYSGAPDVSWADFARAIFAEANLSVAVQDIRTEAYPTPARRPGNSRLDCSATLETFGLQRPDWKRGLKQAISEIEKERS